MTDCVNHYFELFTNCSQIGAPGHTRTERMFDYFDKELPLAVGKEVDPSAKGLVLKGDFYLHFRLSTTLCQFLPTLSFVLPSLRPHTLSRVECCLWSTDLYTECSSY